MAQLQYRGISYEPAKTGRIMNPIMVSGMYHGIKTQIVLPIVTKKNILAEHLNK